MNIIKTPLMTAERDPLGLSSLPPLEPPHDDWPPVREALQRQRRVRLLGGLLAAAAAVTLAIGLTLHAPPSDPLTDTPVETVSEQDILDSLVSLSQQLETQIRSHRERTGTAGSDTLLYQVELEDLVALVDEELSRDPESVQLWSQRVNLLLDINQLYKNQLRREYHNMASL
jgi:hypothetical protein